MIENDCSNSLTDPDSTRLSVRVVASNAGRTDPETHVSRCATVSVQPRHIDDIFKNGPEFCEDTATTILSQTARDVTIKHIKRVLRKGHTSIAEHAVLTISISGISRLALETVERCTHASFTEQSQRYVRHKHNLLYDTLYKGILTLTQDPLAAQEDARYVLPLATTCTQVVVTLNARELAKLIQLCEMQDNKELCYLARQLKEAALPYLPTILPELLRIPVCPDTRAVYIPHYTPGVVLETTNIDDRMLCDNKPCRGHVLRNITHASIAVPDYFAHYTCTFVIRISASAYAQLKRHRMCIITAGDYLPSQVVPANVAHVLRAQGIAEEYESACAPTITNGSERNVRVTFNFKDFYNFCRLRMDKHAQWEIRETANAMASLIKEIAPETGKMLCGTDEFQEQYCKHWPKDRTTEVTTC